MPEEIVDNDQLYRRLVSFHVNPDGTVNSAAFKRRGKPDNSISVDLARLTTPQETLERSGKEGFGLGVLVAIEPRSQGFDVRHDPLPDNPAHSLIEGENNKRKCRLLAEATTVIVPPG
ncbi:MAG: hypothetical protein EBE86_006960 [Hormoscilla sp. GUM202]|nr:hypothetical protein [Hormoscilla sp. GUM202]